MSDEEFVHPGVPGEAGAPDGAAAQHLGEALVDGEVAGGPAGGDVTLGHTEVDGIAHPSDTLEGEGDDADSKRVDDVGLAYDMATEGNSLRTRAAETRRVVTSEKQFKDDLNAILTDPRFLDTSLGHSVLTFLASTLPDHSRPAYAWGRQMPREVSTWAMRELHKLKGRAGSGVFDDTSELKDIPYSDRYNPIESARDVFNGNYDPDAPFREPDLAYARHLDESADKREGWVKLLHEKPVSDAYRERHPNFGFGAYEMDELESMVDSRDGLDWDESYLGEDHLDDPANISFTTVLGSLDTAKESLIKELPEGEENLLQEYDQKLTEQSTTLGDLVQLNKAMRRRHNELLKARAEERKQVLSDVKGGRTNQPPEPADGEVVA